MGYLDYEGLKRYHNLFKSLINNKQSKITATGLLKGDGSGGVTAAVAGTDYQSPLTFNTEPSSNNKVVTMSDMPSVMGASGTNHASGLVPDPGSTQGTSKFLREDGTWVNPIVEGLSVATVSSAASMSIAADKVTIVSGDVGTAAITLTVPNDNNAHVWDILMTTDSTVAVTLAMSDSGTIIYPKDYLLEADTVYEIKIIGTNGTYYLDYGEFVATA